MVKNVDPVFSRNTVEFVAVANEFVKYSEHASELGGDELLRILQRLLPLLYLKGSLIPALEPVFDEGNEKFVTEDAWFRIHDVFKTKFGPANDFIEVFDERFIETGNPVQATLSENMADIYQDLKDFLLLYQTGTREVMNDALFECRMNFENYWGQKILNSLRAIHEFIYSGKEIDDINAG
jgi:hypothetical protein